MRDVETYGEKQWDDYREPQEGDKMTPIEEVELNLRNALKQLHLGYNYPTKRLIEEALEIIERKLL
jgi:hypothetical protein